MRFLWVFIYLFNILNEKRRIQAQDVFIRNLFITAIIFFPSSTTKNLVLSYYFHLLKYEAFKIVRFQLLYKIYKQW